MENPGTIPASPTCFCSNLSVLMNLSGFCQTYINAEKCLMKRSGIMQKEQDDFRKSLNELKSRVTILGSYPIVHEDESRFQLEPGQIKKKLRNDISQFVTAKTNFLMKQARELVAINVSDMSGNPSDSPHTVLAATYLSSRSLKLIGEECLNEIITNIETRNCVCMNIGVDGESLHLATILPDGTKGTVLSLAQSTMKQLQSLSKEGLVRIMSRNCAVDISGRHDMEAEIDEVEEDIIIGNLEENLELALRRYIVDNRGREDTTIEDIETLLGGDSSEVNVKEREVQLRMLSVSELRAIAWKYLFPALKRQWLIKHYGHDKIDIVMPSGRKVEYEPNNVFHRSSKGFLRTVTFDFAHILNLFRESAATGRMVNLGVRVESLEELSKTESFKYLESAIALVKGKLKYDPMNQKCAASLFSEKTVEGLKSVGDIEGATAIQIVSRGLLAMDESGISCIERLDALLKLKHFVESKNEVFHRLKRPDSSHITNELYQMTLCSIDSHICTYLNLEFFNPRRKSTSSVEMLFGQLMMMTDGCTRLNVRQLHDVLQRLMLANALRLVPLKVRGFKFLGYLKRHMKSYRPDDSEDVSSTLKPYPLVFHSQKTISPRNSCFDSQEKKKRRQPTESRAKIPHEGSFDGNVRKFHKKLKRYSFFYYSFLILFTINSVVDCRLLFF